MGIKKLQIGQGGGKSCGQWRREKIFGNYAKNAGKCGNYAEIMRSFFRAKKPEKKWNRGIKKN